MLKHLAIIMDGNRRWAKKQMLMPWLGHKQGIETVKLVIKFCLIHKIEFVSLYTFSLENFKRSQEERDFLFNMIINQAEEFLPELINNQIKIKFYGDKSYYPDNIKPVIEKLENSTQNFESLKLNILFCYGSKQEIVEATKNIAQDIKLGKILPENITPELFHTYLWTGKIPNPELIIRTGGPKRLSNFLLYQAAYSELYFTDKLWPEITEQDLSEALDSYNHIQRKFGA